MRYYLVSIEFHLSLFEGGEKTAGSDEISAVLSFFLRDKMPSASRDFTHSIHYNPLVKRETNPSNGALRYKAKEVQPFAHFECNFMRG